MNPEQIRQLALEIAEQAILQAADALWSRPIDDDPLNPEDIPKIREELKVLAKLVAAS